MYACLYVASSFRRRIDDRYKNEVPRFSVFSFIMMGRIAHIKSLTLNILLAIHTNPTLQTGNETELVEYSKALKAISSSRVMWATRLQI